MNWRERITSDPEIVGGKPVVRGTRISVEFLLELFAAGWSHEDVLESYPHLTAEDLTACFSFAAEAVKDDAVYPLLRGAA